MATKRTVHEVRSKGGEDVERSLKKIGAAGEETGKKIESGSQKAGRGLKAVDAAVAKTRSNMNRLANSLGPVGTGLSKLGAAGLAVAGGVAGAGGLFYLAKRHLLKEMILPVIFQCLEDLRAELSVGGLNHGI